MAHPQLSARVFSVDFHFLDINFFIMAAILSILFSLLFAHIGIKQRRLKLPPGPRGVPVFGYLPFLSRLPHQKMAELAQQYGPLVYMQLGSVPAIVVSSPEMVREVLVTQDRIFGSRPQSYMLKKCFANLGLSNSLAAAVCGSEFQNLRRLYTQQLASPRMVESFQPIRSEEMNDMVRSLWEEGKDGNSVNLNRAILAMLTNINTRVVMKKRYLGRNVDNEEEGRTLEHILRAILQGAESFYVSDFIPMLKSVEDLLFSPEQKLTNLVAHADSFIQSIFEQRQEQLNLVSTDSATCQDCLLDVLLKYQRKDDQLDNQTIKAVMLELLLVVTDGTWVATEWAMAELLCHPKIMQKLREELDAIVGTSHTVQESDIPNLPYLQAVVKETLRLHRPGPFLVPRESTQATQIAGYDIPAQTRVFVNNWAMARDPSVWDRPTEFDPERFLHLTEMEKNDQKFKYLPFGLGRRSCPGMRFGYLNIEAAVARLVHSFDWSSREELNMMEMNGRIITLPLKDPLSHLHIRARLPPHLYFA